MTVAIIDYGMGNIASIVNILKKVGIRSVVTSNPNEIVKADKLILPGVGAFDQGMEKINSIPFLVESIFESVSTLKRPLLGICLGMQILMEKSEEGKLAGLGLIQGSVVKFPRTEHDSKIHMGWNSIRKLDQENPLLSKFSVDERFYFVHGYYVRTENPENTIASTIHGIEFSSIINKENIWGVQFHPEKSHQFGQRLFENFGKIQC